MKRYQHMFEQLAKQKQGAFVPFITIGDPGPELSFEIIKTLIDAGADALELGIPFSDPIADGPTIQSANIRALAAGVTPAICFDIIAKVREYNATIPIGLLLYSNLVMARGIDNFYSQAAAAGVDSVLIADVPLHESKRFRQAATKHNIAPIYIVPSNIDDEDLRQVASYGRGYTYLLSRAGVTGTETAAAMPTGELIDRIRSYNPAPPLLGFGISTPAHVRAALDNGAAGAISGSAIVKLIEQHQHHPAELLLSLQQFVSSMKAAT
ncbi:tryptophan synthase subunit alpha [Rheinheimera salexigens]|uniref:Tryptophan synthase alpha chain n=1 Tax=Rheinheimera salexigens TaxID=1628148 RepID=A0A1E7Q8M6_9GAMM|nr:tryptophan synthase subunit alpha [Rheinheimera salexigens]OEY70413.1 tryptophan synthase subunit alpha [Rheinheimera salexigens]